MRHPLQHRVAYVILSLFLVAAGCDDSDAGLVAGPEGLQTGNSLLGHEADVVLRTDAEAYAPGASMTLILEHQGGERVGYNLCVHRLEARSGESWEALASNRICTAHIAELAPGQTATYETTVPTGLAEGEYRVRLPLYLPERGEQRDVLSDALWVTEVWDTEASHEASLSLPSAQEAMRKGRPLIVEFEELIVTTPLGGHGLDRAEARRYRERRSE